MCVIYFIPPYFPKKFFCVLKDIVLCILYDSNIFTFFIFPFFPYVLQL